MVVRGNHFYILYILWGKNTWTGPHLWAFPCRGCQYDPDILGLNIWGPAIYFRMRSTDRNLQLYYCPTRLQEVKSLSREARAHALPVFCVMSKHKAKINAVDGQGGWGSDTKCSPQKAALKFSVSQRQTANRFLNLLSRDFLFWMHPDVLSNHLPSGFLTSALSHGCLPH